eukprot:TRINITY_DN1552_c0_g3_i4.p1 TRINITY_DN1552_c0_g3~~TRINITY_DN1552_c0_g3_i4.p1  ORF type:complete len:2126 (+),score=399.70 TRINITY_DN1552_c0_g3_i4:112-6489(+)
MEHRKGGGSKALREALFATGSEERVEVNQRHLIDKILARYSSEFTLFRELIQNANDAGATDVEVLMTAPSYRPQPETDESGIDHSQLTQQVPVESSSAATAASSIASIFKLGWSTWNSADDEEVTAPSNAPRRIDDEESGLGKCAVHELEIRNNGRRFSKDDWKRIKSIAEGNPNSDSCGMFGVGFYSVFSITENPLVRSGDEALVFHWRGDGLVTTSAKIDVDSHYLQPAVLTSNDTNNKDATEKIESSTAEKSDERTVHLESRKDWVSFVLEAREEMPFDLDDLSRFLVKTVAFTTKVRVVRLFVNNRLLFTVSKSTPEHNKQTSSTQSDSLRSENIAVPSLLPNEIVNRHKAGHGYMTIKSMMVQDIEVAVWRLEGDKEVRFKVDLKQVEAKVDVHWKLVPDFLENMKRILKKTPPSQTTILLLYNSKVNDTPADLLLGKRDNRNLKKKKNRRGGGGGIETELDGSAVNPSPYSFFSFLSAQQQGKPARQEVDNDDDDAYEKQLTADLFPCPNNGHVFIGFSTHQTTGSGYHLAAQLIPTVERENIDFQDVYISNWNCTLLTAAGRVARLFHEYSLVKLQPLVKSIKWDSGNRESSTLSPEEKKIEDEVIALLQAHSFNASHPSENVAQLLYKYFFIPYTTNAKLDTGLLVPCASGGLIESSKARLPYLGMEDFIVSPTDGLVAVESGSSPFAVIPKHILAKAPRFFQQLEGNKIIRPLSLDDMLQHLRTRTISLDEWSKLTKWFQNGDVQQQLFPSKKGGQKVINRLLAAITVAVPKRNDEDALFIRPQQQKRPAAAAKAESAKQRANNQRQRAQIARAAAAASLFESKEAAELKDKSPEKEKEQEHEQESKIEYIEQNLGEISYFLPKNKLQLGIPVPPSTCHPEISDICTNRAVLKDSFEWKELTFPEWWHYMTINMAPVVAQSAPVRRGQAPPPPRPTLLEHYLNMPLYTIKVLRYIGTLFPTLEEKQKNEIISFLSPRAILPIEEKMAGPTQATTVIQSPTTKTSAEVPAAPAASTGTLYKPADVYFPQVSLFEDIKHVRADVLQAIPNKSFLKALGVRENVELRLVLDRLETLKWDLPYLLRFLATEQTAFTTNDWNLLRNSAFLPGIVFTPCTEPSAETTSGGPDNVSTPQPTTTTTVTPQRMQPQRAARTTKEAAPLPLNGTPLAGLKRPFELFFPHTALKELSLPVLDWPAGHELDTRSRQAVLLKRIGLLDQPTLSSLFAIAADPAMNSLVLTYMERHIDDLIKREPKFRISDVVTPIFPALRPISARNSFIAGNKGVSAETHTPIVALPGECFIHGSPFGFAHVEPRWVNLAKKLGIPDHPSLVTILHMMIKEPPANIEEAKTIFAYFASRLSEFDAPHWELLRKAKFIPVLSSAMARGGDERIEHYTVNDVLVVAKQTRATPVSRAKQAAASKDEDTDPSLLESSEEANDLFVWVDFGDKGNTFLHNCGVAHHPTPEIWARSLLARYRNYIQKHGFRKYLLLLYQFSHVFPRLPATSPYVKQLISTPLFLGIVFLEDADKKEVVIDRDEESEEPLQKGRKEDVVLRLAKECYLIDNERYLFLFNPPRVPNVVVASSDSVEGSKTGGTTLEAMYEQLGATWITKNVQHATRPVGKPSETAQRAVTLKNRLEERKALLVHTMQGKRRTNAYGNAETIIKNLHVAAVQEINRVLTFGDKKVTEKAVVSVKKDSADKRKVTMYIAEKGGDIDYFDVGTEVAQLLYSKPGHDDALLAAMLLQTPLPTLRRKGWPVDRLLQNKVGSTVSSEYKQAQRDAALQDDSATTNHKDGHQPQQQQLQKQHQQQQQQQQKQQQQQLKADSAPQSASPHQVTPAASDPLTLPPPEPQSLWQRVSNYWSPPPPTATPAPAPAPVTTQPARTPTKSQQQPSDGVTRMGGNTMERTEHRAPTSPVSGMEHQHAMDDAMRRALGSLSQFSGASELQQQASTQESVHYSCEQLPAQNLSYVDRFDGIPLYLQEGARMTQAHGVAVREFAGLLTDLAAVFGFRTTESLVMFCDYNGSRIAFNRDCTLYFNLRMFVDLRHTRRSAEACIFWYLTACHELAHNNVSVHNEEHESLLSWLAYRNMLPLMQHVHTLLLASSSPTTTTSTTTNS